MGVEEEGLGRADFLCSVHGSLENGVQPCSTLIIVYGVSHLSLRFGKRMSTVEDEGTKADAYMPCHESWTQAANEQIYGTTTRWLSRSAATLLKATSRECVTLFGTEV